MVAADYLWYVIATPRPQYSKSMYIAQANPWLLHTHDDIAARPRKALQETHARRGGAFRSNCLNIQLGQEPLANFPPVSNVA